MKKKLISTFLRGMMFLALAVALAPRSATAQVSEVGKFSLPFEVHWGTAVLPAGAYRFSVGDIGPSDVVHVFKEDGPSASYLILPHGWDRTAASSERSQLVFERKDGEVYVKELLLGSEGLTLYYGAPKLKKKDALARSAPSRRDEIPMGK